MPDLPLLPSDSEYSLSSYPSLSDSSRPQTTAIDTQDLPVPTTPQPFPTKKSHARKQPQGHIPRPRNAFILFRCDYTRQKQPTLQQYDQNGVSRLVGEIWRNMNADQREPWVLMAEAEKKKHAALYPGYKFNPRSRKQPPTQESVQRLMAKEAEKVVTVEVEVAAHAREEQEEWKKKMVEIYYPPWATRRSLTQFARRAMSCPPPGAIGVEPYSELVDRAIVTTDGSSAAHVQSAPSSPTMDSFVPSTYNIEEVDSCPPSGRVTPDRLLSECLYTIDPPGGANSWGNPPSSESLQQQAQQDGPLLFAPRPVSYAPPETFMATEYYATDPIDHSDNYSSAPETPPFDPSSPSASSSSSMQSPTTPTMPHAWPPVQVAAAYDSPEAHREFVSEFGNMSFQPEWSPYFMIPKEQTW